MMTTQKLHSQSILTGTCPNHTAVRPRRPRFGHVPRSASTQLDQLDQTCSSAKQPDEGPAALLRISRRQLLHAASAAALCISAGALNPAAAAAAGGAAANCDLQTSATGLKWCDLAVGDGSAPIKGAFTKAHYTAQLASNGAVFDSSYQRKQPLIFKVGENEVITAMDVAVLGAEDIPAMREGGKRLVVAPPGPLQRQGTKSLVWMVGMLQALEDAGELSADGRPTSDLVFEIELLAKKRSRG